MRRLALALALLAGPALADDLDLIPGGVLDGAAAPPPAPSAYTLFVEDTLTVTDEAWGNLARLGLRGGWRLGGGFAFAVDAQATHTAGDAHDRRADLKEAILAWAGPDGWFAEAGRMTLKTGVASGFNPTDHFRAFSLITTTTEDASQWREHRVGAWAVRGQKLWPGGGAGLAVAEDDRAMLTLTQTVAPDLAPQLVAYVEDDRPHFGGNVSYGIGDSLVLYAEADLGRRGTLLDEAFRRGEERWLAQAAVGASYSLDAQVTAAVEWHFNQAGLHAIHPAARTLARDRQEPLGRHALWSRLAYAEAFGDPDLTLTALAVTDPLGPSALLQAEAAYALSGSTTAALRGAVWLGGEDTVYGGANKDMAVTVQVRHGF